MTDSPLVLAGIVVVILAVVGGIAVTIVRSRSDNSHAVAKRASDDELNDAPNERADLWSRLVATEDGSLGVPDRLDMVARLEMVGEKWCIDALQSATHEEEDPHVNAAARATLARLRA